MKLQDYIKANEQKKIKTDIIERWQSRIVPRQLWTHGEDGARVYIEVLKFGNSIAAPKCLQFGQLALNEGYSEFAAGFFKWAAKLQGITLEDSEVTPTDAPKLAPKIQTEEDPAFPRNMQPGKFVPMQPSDAKQNQSYYIRNDSYHGQPKRKGVKLIAFVSQERAIGQSRQLKVSEIPEPELAADLVRIAQKLGNFIVEGELVYLDCSGAEFQTGSEAATSNLQQGSQAMPIPMYYIFNCVWHNGIRLDTYGEMVAEGKDIALSIESPVVSFVYTYKSRGEKEFLAALQKSEGREGEIWFDPNMPYTPGKNSKDVYVRTKYSVGTRTYFISEIMPTTATGHTIGGFSIVDENGNDLGTVGTGYTRAEQKEILRRFQAGETRVLVDAQNVSAYGKLIHARFEGFPE